MGERASTVKMSVAMPLLLTGLLASGCQSTPVKSAGSVVFPKPAEAVQKAAVNALVVTGFDVQRAEPLYVQGYRPRRWGLVVGSGGETVGVWLEPEAADRTRLRIDTARTFVGGAGQKDWSGAVVREMVRELGLPE